MKIMIKAGFVLVLTAAGRLAGAISLDVTDPGKLTGVFNVLWRS